VNTKGSKRKEVRNNPSMASEYFMRSMVNSLAMTDSLSGHKMLDRVNIMANTQPTVDPIFMSLYRFNRVTNHRKPASNDEIDKASKRASRYPIPVSIAERYWGSVRLGGYENKHRYLRFSDSGQLDAIADAVNRKRDSACVSSETDSVVTKSRENNDDSKGSSATEKVPEVQAKTSSLETKTKTSTGSQPASASPRGVRGKSSPRGNGEAAQSNSSKVDLQQMLEPVTRRENIPTGDAIPGTNGLTFEIERVVPIRLNIDLLGIRLRDTFLYDIHETAISPLKFAKILVQDLKLPQVFEGAIEQSIYRQLLDVEDYGHVAGEMAKTGSVHLIYIDICIDDKILHDVIEWDIFNEWNCPETFAKSMARDLGLDRKFILAIATTIREQAALYKRAILHPKAATESYDGVKPKGKSGTALGSKAKKRKAEEDCLWVMPPLSKHPFRSKSDSKFYQPVLSQMNTKEKSYLANWSEAVASPESKSTCQELFPTVDMFQDVKIKKSIEMYEARLESIQNDKDKIDRVSWQEPTTKDTDHWLIEAPKPIKHLTPFLAFFQTNKPKVSAENPDLNTSGIRRVLGDQWKNSCTLDDKQNYNNMANVENEKRLSEFSQYIRKNSVLQWQEREARRKRLGFLEGSKSLTVLDCKPDHIANLFLEEYMTQRTTYASPAPSEKHPAALKKAAQ